MLCSWVNELVNYLTKEFWLINCWKGDLVHSPAWFLFTKKHQVETKVISAVNKNINSFWTWGDFCLFAFFFLIGKERFIRKAPNIKKKGSIPSTQVVQKGHWWARKKYPQGSQTLRILKMRIYHEQLWKRINWYENMITIE